MIDNILDWFKSLCSPSVKKIDSSSTEFSSYDTWED